MYDLEDNERIDDLNLDGLKIIQNTKYFCFGIDSVLLSNFVKNTKSKAVVMDFCTGSAIIPILLSKKIKCSKIYGVEIQEKMYELAKKNIELNNLNDKIKVVKEDIKKVANIKEILKQDGLIDTVDIITANPPYKKVDSGIQNKDEIKNVARHEIMCNIEDIIYSSSKLLKNGGKLYLVHKKERLTDVICISRKYSMEVKKIELVTCNNKISVVLFEIVKGANPHVIIETKEIEENNECKK